MREDLLHFIWKYKRLGAAELVSTSGERVIILNCGTHNQLAGPDFFNAKLRIGDQTWAGNVEIHLKSSDWYAHNHEIDPKYNSVILHVVWEDDGKVFRSDNSEIATLELKQFISPALLNSYRSLFSKEGVTFINCEKDIAQVEPFVLTNWLERLYFERLEQKSKLVSTLLKEAKNDWEAVLFKLLLKNFGLKVNGEAFLSLSRALHFSVVRKLCADPLQLESVLLGLSHMLEDDTSVDTYYRKLKDEYSYLKNKFDLDNLGVQRPEFYKLRPTNFPTLRLSQLANLYATHQNLFHQVIKTSDLVSLYALFDISASQYWTDHYTFGKTSKKSKKKLTKKFIDLLIINTILPLKFCYAKAKGEDANEDIVRIISEIQKEENSIITNFKKNDLKIDSAKDSQALLQLYNQYCTQNKCLQCAIGGSLLAVNN